MAALMGLAMLVQVGLVDGTGNGEVVEAPEPEPEVVQATPYNYLYASYPSLARRLDCVIQRESRWDTGAYNPRSGAAGLAQFLLGTWLSTPQGKAGASRYDPYAAIDGAAWIITTDRKGWGHWTPILFGMC